jgi:hypothetical protein
MDGQLTEVCCPEPSSTEWLTLLEDLRQDVAALRNRVDHLERENFELRQQAGYWQSRHRDALRRIGQLEQQVEHLQARRERGRLNSAVSATANADGSVWPEPA